MKNKPNPDILLNDILECSFDLICLLDPEIKFTKVSPSARKILGYDPSEMEGKSFFDFIHPEDVNKTVETFHLVAQGQKIDDFKNRLVNKNGIAVYMEWTGRNNAGAGLMFCTGRDTTEIKNLCEELEKSNEKFYLVTQATHDAIWDWDIERREVTWGYGYKENFGYDVNDPLTNYKNWAARIHPDDSEGVINSIMQALEKDNFWQKEYRYKKLDESYAFVSDKAVILRDKDNQACRMIGAMQNTTERRLAEQQLALSEQRFRSLVQSGSDLIAIVNTTGDYIYVSPTAEHILGYKPEFFIGRNAFDFVHEEDRETTLSGLQKITTENKVQLVPFRFLHANGEWRWIETILTDMTGDPAVNGIVANSRDVTEKKQVFEQLEMLSLIAKETSNPVVITDHQRKITWVNTAFTKISGYTLEEVKGKQTVDILSGPETSPEAIKQLENVSKTLQPAELEITFYSKSGKKYIVEKQLQPIIGENGKVISYFGMQHDITEKKKLQKQLSIEQVERTRRVAKEVIHALEQDRAEIGSELHDNVNQVLTTIKLFLENIQYDPANIDTFLKKSISYLQKCIEEIRKISKRLCAYLDEAGLQASILDLADNMQLAGAPPIQLDFTLDEKIISQEHKLSIYRIIQEQLNNIIKYANASLIKISVLTQEKQLLLSIRDNGIGFDTRKIRKGIGLKNIKNRAAMHFGTITLMAAPGKGCSLNVLFDLSKSGDAPTI